MTFAQRLRDGGVQCRGIRSAFFQILFHHVVVHFHHAFDEGAVHVGHGHDVGFPRVVIKAVNDVRATFGGEVDGKNPVAESIAQFA